MKYFYFSLILYSLFACNQVPKPQQEVIKVDTSLFEVSEEFKLETDTSLITFLWQEKTWNEDLRDTLEKIQINQEYAQTASPEAKAILAYLSLLAGSECWWQGEKANDDMSNLQCLILSALNMGFACSKEHLEPLQIAFARDTVALQTISQCVAVPYTATYQNAFTDITIQKRANFYYVNFKALQINSKKNTSKPWSNLMIFKITETGISITKNITYSNL